MSTNAIWVVYIIQTHSGKLYTGITNNLKRRFHEHQERKVGAKYFRLSAPEKIVFQEIHLSRSEASKKEIKIKNMSRKQKIDLISKAKICV